MEENESFNFFMRMIDEKHKQQIAAFNSLKVALVSENQISKVESAKALQKANDFLANAQATQDRPEWLVAISSATNQFLAGPTNQNYKNALLESVIKNQAALTSHTWDFSGKSASNDYCFDEIFERFRAESRLQELFDSMIETLEKIIESKEIDSINTIDSLKGLLSMLKGNRSGSYFSTMASWEFVGSFIGNSLWEGLEDIPVLGSLKRGFEKTMNEADLEMETLHQKISEEMKTRYRTVVQQLTYKKTDNKLLEKN